MSRPTQVLVTGAAGFLGSMLVGQERPALYADVWSDTTAAREALGFEPKISIEEGIGRFADWLRGRP
jgi:nucleoside-diphosphate-sugar epimerase